MLRSMTGFGAATREEGELVLHAEVRSVNHRHLLVKSRLGNEFSALEGDVDALVKKRLARGSVTINLQATRSRGGDAASLRSDVAERYKADIEALAMRLGVGGQVSLDTLLSLPGVIAPADDDATDSKRIHRAALAVIDGALLRLIEMRRQERDEPDNVTLFRSGRHEAG